MIHEYVADLAMQMGVQLSSVTMAVTTPDVYQLELAADDKAVTEWVHHSEIDNLKNARHSDLLEIKIRSALARLKLMLEP